MKALMVLGARRGQVPVIRTARAMGLDVIVVDPDRDAPGMQMASTAYVHDLADEAACLETARSHRVSGAITAGADYPIPVLASLCEALDLPGLRPRQSALGTNKRLMRDALSSGGAPCPRFAHVTSSAEALLVRQAWGTDVIFKPAMSQAGRGITRVRTGSSASIVAVAFDRARQETRADSVLVEEYVEGPEYSVEALTYQGRTEVIALTDKTTSGEPYYVEMGHNQPSFVSRRDAATLKETARHAVSALGLDNCASHTELRLGIDGPRIMEVGARLGGGYITTHLVPLSTGVDLVRATIQVALGETPDLTRGVTQGAAIRFLAGGPGEVCELAGIERARETRGLVDIDVYVTLGMRIPALTDASGRTGHVICTGSDATTAIERAELARDCIHVTLAPDETDQSASTSR